MLLADDQRFDTIHALGNAEIRTPHLDRLVREGFAFTHAFIMGSGQPAVCVPRRAVLMTGRTLFRATTSFTNGIVPRLASTLPGTLREAGYATYLVGKWHNDKPSLARSFSGGGPIFFGGMADHTRVPVQAFDPGGVYAQTNERIATKFSSELTEPVRAQRPRAVGPAGPGVPRGGRSDALVYLFDVFPTVCGLTGVSVPPTVEGKNLGSVLRGRRPRVRDAIFAAYRDAQRRVRDERWKLIWYPKIQRYQLFDLKRDPQEVRDLSGNRRYSSGSAALHLTLAEMQARLDDTSQLKQSSRNP